MTIEEFVYVTSDETNLIFGAEVEICVCACILRKNLENKNKYIKEQTLRMDDL